MAQSVVERLVREASQRGRHLRRELLGMREPKRDGAKYLGDMETVNANA